MIDQLVPELARRLVGVIDLANGRAVHAIAGKRHAYRDVPFCGGDPNELARRYQRLGLNAIYVADLDAIGGHPLQQDALRQILRNDFQHAIIDVGWTGEAADRRWRTLRALSSEFPKACWVAATESCQSTDGIETLARSISPAGVMLGLDYQEGDFCTRGPSENDWVSAARQGNCVGAVVLDVAAVGTSRGPVTAAACRRLSGLSKDFEVYSGGGVRNLQDIEQLIDAGCKGVLVATALYPEVAR